MMMMVVICDGDDDDDNNNDNNNNNNNNNNKIEQTNKMKISRFPGRNTSNPCELRSTVIDLFLLFRSIHAFPSSVNKQVENVSLRWSRRWSCRIYHRSYHTLRL